MISELFAKYQFGAIHIADNTDGTVANHALCSAESEIFRRSYMPLDKGLPAVQLVFIVEHLRDLVRLTVRRNK